MENLMDLYTAYPFWIWAGFAAALLAVEILTGSGWLLWASASAAVVAGASAFGLSLTTALLLFAALTAVSTLAARRYIPKCAAGEGADINDNIGRLVGARGAAAGPFENGVGRVFIDGKEWAAEAEGAGPVPLGAPLLVVGVSGARLRVRTAPRP
jgi:membrane protein implicated in regulation of membrane protease activity